MPEKTLNVAIIGQGFMGRAHSNAYCQVGHFFDTPYRLRRKVICGRNAAGLAKIASTWGWEETATDWRAVVERPDVDIIDLAVPNALHAGIAIAAAQAGKIVLCEKPLAVSVDEARRMARRSADAPTWSGSTTAASPPSPSLAALSTKAGSDRSSTIAPATSRNGATTRPARPAGSWIKLPPAPASWATCSRTSSIPRSTSTAPSPRSRR